MTAYSTQGLYAKRKKQLFLEGNVRIAEAQKYSVCTSQALINFKDRQIGGTQNVFGSLAQGSFCGTGFHVQNDILTVWGPCHLSVPLEK